MRITYSKAARRALLRSNKRRLLYEKIGLLAEDPDALANNVIQLSGSDDFQLRVQDWRVIFTKREEEIYIYEVVLRGSAYED